jgi:hypothetical protein
LRQEDDRRRRSGTGVALRVSSGDQAIQQGSVYIWKGEREDEECVFSLKRTLESMLATGSIIHLTVPESREEFSDKPPIGQTLISDEDSGDVVEV